MYVLLIVFCHFVFFLLAIVLSVLLRYTDSDCPFGIFKPFLGASLVSLIIYTFNFGQIKQHDAVYSQTNLMFLFMQKMWQDKDPVIYTSHFFKIHRDLYGVSLCEALWLDFWNCSDSVVFYWFFFILFPPSQ